MNRPTTGTPTANPGPPCSSTSAATTGRRPSRPCARCCRTSCASTAASPPPTPTAVPHRRRHVRPAGHAHRGQGPHRPHRPPHRSAARLSLPGDPAHGVTASGGTVTAPRTASRAPGTARTPPAPGARDPAWCAATTMTATETRARPEPCPRRRRNRRARARPAHPAAAGVRPSVRVRDARVRSFLGPSLAAGRRMRPWTRTGVLGRKSSPGFGRHPRHRPRRDRRPGPASHRAARRGDPRRP
ncbi:hypothetical protein LT493_44165 [Streptomyces tricolor]|nr:hypothetical protein [Streptomyces tricolor]